MGTDTKRKGEAMLDAAQQRAMFGCTLEEFKASVHLYDLEKPADALMVSMSLQSDAQELLAMNEHEQARQRLNLSKYLVGEVREKLEAIMPGLTKLLEATGNDSEFTSGRLDTPTWSAVAALRKALVANPESDWSRGAK